MKAVRAALVAVILFDLALLACVGPFRATRLRYEVGRKQRELRDLTLLHQTLQHEAACARRPDAVAARAAALGVDLRALEAEDAVVRAPAAAPAPNPVPRR